MPKHTVAEGECLSSIAHRYGFFWKTLWDHPENAALREGGREPNILFPGDVVLIPDKREAHRDCATGARHTFRVRGVPVMLRLRVLWEDDPRAGERFELDVDGRKTRGLVGDDGVVLVAIDPQARRGKLTVGEGERLMEYSLSLGHLAPIGTASGVKARLANLGFDCGSVDDTMDDATAQAIRGFQASAGLPPPGSLDDATRARLAEAHDGP